MHGLPNRNLAASAINAKYDSGGKHLTTDDVTWGPCLAGLIKRGSRFSREPRPFLDVSRLLDTDNLVGFVKQFALNSPNADSVLRGLGDVMLLTATIHEDALDDTLLSVGEEGVLMHLLSLSPDELNTIDICEEAPDRGDKPRRRCFLIGWALATELGAHRMPPYDDDSYESAELTKIDIINVPFAVRGSNYGELLVDLLFALHLHQQTILPSVNGPTMEMTRPVLPASPLDNTIGYWVKSSQKGFNNLIHSTMHKDNSYKGTIREITLSEEELKVRLKYVTQMLNWPDELFNRVYEQSIPFIKDLREKRSHKI